MQVSDYYKILGVDPGAGPERIRSAYRRLARRYHPDVAKSTHTAQRFLLIREAYEVLSDPEKRRQYDELISKPSLASRASRTRPTQSRTQTATAEVEVRAERRGFRLILDALGVLRLDVGVDLGAPSRGTGPRRRHRTSITRRREE